MRLSRREFAKLAALSVGMGLYAGGVPSAHAAPASPPLGTLDALLPIHPLLQLVAAQVPLQKIDIIVQKRHGSDNAAAIAAAGEGTVLDSFSLIKAHRMRVKAGKLIQLALRGDILYISPDGPTKHHAEPDTSLLATSYPASVQATDAWPAGTGAGVAVAILDTGLTIGPDFGGHTRAYNLNPRTGSVADPHGHGTHIAGIIKGRSASGAYVGIAPDCNLISAKIADERGIALTSDLLRGLQWVYDKRNGIDGSGPIKVVSLSTTVAIPESYLTSAICAAVEKLWAAGIVVVCAAGNRGTDLDATWYPPANDPYVITVGATDDNGTPTTGDDVLAPFSSRGTTQDLRYKPDIVAPGRRIVSTLASPTSTIATLYPERLADAGHIRLSGTSMSAPIVAGAVALLRARFPQLTPNQIKWLITAKGTQAQAQGAAPLLNVQQAAAWVENYPFAVAATNLGLLPSLNIALPSARLSFVQAYWDQAYWDQTYWDQAYWDQAYWDQAYWDQTYWDADLAED